MEEKTLFERTKEALYLLIYTLFPEAFNKQTDESQFNYLKKVNPQMFLGGGVAETKEEYENVPGKKAIVLLGYPYSGMRCFVRDFLKNFPEFKFLSYNSICYDIIDKKKASFQADVEKLADNVFGKSLAEGDNIIIDYSAYNIITRSVLIRTLKALGYKVYLFSFLFMTIVKMEENIEKELKKEFSKRGANYYSLSLEERNQQKQRIKKCWLADMQDVNAQLKNSDDIFKRGGDVYIDYSSKV